MNDALYLLFNGLSFLIPNEASIHIDASGNCYDHITGEVGSGWGDAAVSDVTGSNTDDYAAGVGMCVDWSTTVVANRRRIRGRTFLVPLAGCYDGLGHLDATQKAAVQALLDTFWGNVREFMVIWHRPVDNTGGQAPTVSGVSIAQKPAFVRKRR
jgi:hypothetical protein